MTSMATPTSSCYPSALADWPPLVALRPGCSTSSGTRDKCSTPISVRPEPVDRLRTACRRARAPSEKQRLQVAQEVEAARGRPDARRSRARSSRAARLRRAPSAIADSGSPVRSLKRASSKPSRRRSALSMNSNGSCSRATSSSFDIALPASASRHVASPARASAPAARRGAGSSACRARRRRCRGSRRTASSSGCARSDGPAARRPRPRSAPGPPPRVRSTMQVEHVGRECRRRAAPAGAWRTRCSARSSGGRSTGAAARTPAPVAGRRRSSASVWPGSAYIRSRLKVSKAARASSTAARACARVVHAAERLQLRVVEALHADRQARHAGRAIGAEALALEGAGVGLERDLAAGLERQRARGRRRAAGRCLGREQARRAAADEDAVHAAAPDERQRRFEVGAQRIEVARFGERSPRCSCELKSQYGHFFRHHGRCTYSDSGGSAASFSVPGRR